MLQRRVLLALGLCAVAVISGSIAWLCRPVDSASIEHITMDGHSLVVRATYYRLREAAYSLARYESESSAEPTWETPLPRCGGFVMGAQHPGSIVLSLEVCGNEDGQEPASEHDVPYEGGECVVDAATGEIVFCHSHPGGTISLGVYGGLLVALVSSPPRLIAHRFDDDAIAWTALIPGAPEDATLHVAATGAIGVHADRRYFSLDLERGTLTLASPDGAERLCVEGSFVVASEGGRISATRDDPIAWRTIAEPGPGALLDCTSAGAVTPSVWPDAARRPPPPIAISWCAASGPAPFGARSLPLTAHDSVPSGCALYVIDADLAVPAAMVLPGASGLGPFRVWLDGTSLEVEGTDVPSRVRVDVFGPTLRAE